MFKPLRGRQLSFAPPTLNTCVEEEDDEDTDEEEEDEEIKESQIVNGIDK